ncbi:MAG: hypothetical protein E4G98_03870, partial [Promethearchaeota archaeon]
MVLIHSIIQQVAQFDGSLFIPTFSTFPIIFLLPLIPVLLLALWGSAFTYLSVEGIILQVMKIPVEKHKKHRQYVILRIFIAIFILGLS